MGQVLAPTRLFQTREICGCSLFEGGARRRHSVVRPKWLEPCLRTLLPSLAGVDAEVLVVDNWPREGTRGCSPRTSPPCGSSRVPNHGFSHANNRGAATCDARYVLFLNPDTEIVEGNFGTSSAAMDDRPDGRPGRRPPADRRRHAVADDPLLPERRRARSARRSPRSAGRAAPRWAGERELDLDALRPRARLRLDLGLVHARPPRGAARRRPARRALLHLLRGDRSLPAGQAGRLGDPPPAVDDDRPPRRQGRGEAENGRPGRLVARRQYAAQALLPADARPPTSARCSPATRSAPSPPGSDARPAARPRGSRSAPSPGRRAAVRAPPATAIAAARPN